MLHWLTRKLTLCFFSALFTTIFGFVCSLGLFALLEFYPGLIASPETNALPYYALRKRYLPDSNLVFRNRPNFVYNGSIGSHIVNHPILSKEFTPIPYKATFNENGFRPDTVQGEPYVVVVGDSFVATGEKDSTTLTAHLSNQLQQNVKNLGTSWYGPSQYLEVFKRFGISARPRYALFVIFEGNDARDTREYMKFKDSGVYYGFDFRPQSFWKRYTTVVSQGKEFLEKLFLKFVRTPIAKLRGRYVDADMQIALHVTLPGNTPSENTFWDSLTYEPESRSLDEARTTKEWKTISETLSEFQRLAKKANIIPIAALAPMKPRVYASYLTDKTSAKYDQLRKSGAFDRSNAEDIIHAYCNQIGLPFVSLYDSLKSLADTGTAPYYRFDTHWNSEGRKAAAQKLAEVIRTMDSPAPPKEAIE